MSPLAIAGGLTVLAALCYVGLARLGKDDAATPAPAPAIAAEPAPKAHFSDDVAMVTVTGGAMKQGRNGGPADEAPVHEVTVPPFRLDAHEVTVAAYEACVATGECSPAGRGDEECNSGRADRATHPINCVDFAQATEYCAAQGKELPTEEEWEFAARQGHDKLFPWGSRAPTAADACFQRGDGNDGTCPVGSHAAARSTSGVDDLAGNVLEWTDSAYCGYGHPDCFDTRRVVRGGSYASASAELLTTTVRIAFAPTTRAATLGFRCAKTR